MPVTNGCNPEAPGGGHSSHAGAVLEAPAAAEPDARAGPDELAAAPSAIEPVLAVADELPSTL